jgi:hypothetical protein
MLKLRSFRRMLARTFPNIRIFAMPESWKVEIFDRGNGTIAFRPDVRGAKDGDPLRASIGDLISWTNRTDKEVNLETIGPQKVPNFNRTIRAGEPSDFFQLDRDRIEYRCIDPLQNHEIRQFDPLVG